MHDDFSPEFFIFKVYAFLKTSWEMNRSFALLLALLLSFFIFGCNNPDYSYLYGFWELEINENDNKQNFVAYFFDDEGEIQCDIHSYYNGLKFSPEPASKIKLNRLALSMIANQSADVKFSGDLDTINQLIDGRLIYADGSGRDFDLQKVTEQELFEKYPGLERLTIMHEGSKLPIEINDGWPVATLTNEFCDLDLLNSMVNKIIDDEFGNVHSVLIALDGKLVFEEYFDGYYINDLHSLQSCTKSIGSLLIGIAIDKGYIIGTSQKVISFFPEYSENIDQRWEEIQLKDLLTMSIGLSWDRKLHDNIYAYSNDVIQTTFKQNFNESLEKEFEYRNPQADLLSGILKNSTGKSVQEFSMEYLFNPLGISSISWDNFKDNDYPLMSGSLGLKPRDLLKIGQLVLDSGVFKEEKVISSDWIEESTSFKTKTDQTFDYGYLWWLRESARKPNVKVIFAMGIGGQHIVIIPDLSTVIVTTADNMDRSPEVVLKMIDECIIAGIKITNE